MRSVFTLWLCIGLECNIVLICHFVAPHYLLQGDMAFMVEVLFLAEEISSIENIQNQLNPGSDVGLFFACICFFAYILFYLLGHQRECATANNITALTWSLARAHHSGCAVSQGCFFQIASEWRWRGKLCSSMNQAVPKAADEVICHGEQELGRTWTNAIKCPSILTCPPTTPCLIGLPVKFFVNFKVISSQNEKWNHHYICWKHASSPPLAV